MALAAATWLLTTPASGFPGIYVGKDNARRVVHTTHVVLLLHEALNVVTIMPDYAGPMTAFAVIIPVPIDVTLKRIETVKREFVGRVEEVSAPRFHVFYEMDPCQPGVAKQQWEYKIKANPTPGFLAAPFVPPADGDWKVPKELSIPIEPVFKGPASEFSFTLLSADRPEQVADQLAERGYQLSATASQALEPHLGSGLKLLMAEVDLDRVELVGTDQVQLSGIRYWSRQPTTLIRSTLGLLNADGYQDLFLYVLHRNRRFEVKDYGNLFLPNNLRVAARVKERVAQLYNALFDLSLERQPRSFVTEYVWSTEACGQPCPNAPLQLRELLSLGGDLLEAETVTRAERFPEPPEETAEAKQQLERELELLSSSKRIQARKEHKRVRHELARRQALLNRQRYVLSRLHYRYRRPGLPRDVELVPARAHVSGGVGVPRGPRGELSNRTASASESTYQVRFVDLKPWTRDVACERPTRWRWGKRWSFMGHVLRKVFIARDLPRSKRDPKPLAATLLSPLPEYGLRVPEPERAPLPTRPKPTESTSACSCSTGMRSVPAPVVIAWLLTWAIWARRRASCCSVIVGRGIV